MGALIKQAAAFRDVLGLETLPQTGRQAQAAARQLGEAVLAGVAPTPLLSQLVAEELAAGPRPKPRFVDVSTGLRLRYLEWRGPGSGTDVVLLLHDLGESADIWRHLGARLADRGYRVLALDLRGHGESGRSLDGRYSAEALAEDVKAFVVALDLYVAPLAVVGCGMGAAAGLALAQAAPFLVGALVAAEFTLPVAALQAAAEGCSAAGDGSEGSKGSSGSGGQQANGGSGSQGGSQAAAQAPDKAQQQQPAFSSKVLLPWWGFRAGQASEFGSVEQCAAMLAHPLSNLGPAALLPLETAAARLAAAATAAAEAAAAAAPGVSSGQANSSSSNDSEAGSSGSSAQEAVREAAQALQDVFAPLQRPLRGAVASALSLLRLPQGMTAGGGFGRGFVSDYWAEEDWDGPGAGKLQPRMDPPFLFTFDPSALLARLPDMRCHLLLLRGDRGGWADAADAEAMAAMAAAGGAASAAVADAIPGAGHCLAADCPDQLLKAVVAFLEGPAICCFSKRALPCACSRGCGALAEAQAGLAGAAAAERRPELLGLRPLPEFSSLEEAQKALGPRRIPTAAAIDAELRKLRLEEGRAASDASSEGGEGQEGSGREEEGRKHQTALARDPPTYFGFVG